MDKMRIEFKTKSIYTVAIDPGLRGCGVSIFRDTQLVKAKYVEAQTEQKELLEVALNTGVNVELFVKEIIPNTEQTNLVLELPQAYGAPSAKGDPNDLIHITLVIGAILGRMCYEVEDLTHYLPRQWKGQVPKDIHHERILSRLTEPEKTCITHVGYKDHNTLDAVGIGLYHLGRMSRRAEA